jgi:hypothetical protein
MICLAAFANIDEVIDMIRSSSPAYDAVEKWCVESVRRPEPDERQIDMFESEKAESEKMISRLSTVICIARNEYDAEFHGYDIDDYLAREIFRLMGSLDVLCGPIAADG